MRSGLSPLALVSDDSAMMGVVAGIRASGEAALGLVWLDARGDLNTPQTSPSGLLFGMPLAHLLGLGHEDLLALEDQGPVLDEARLVLVGVRCLDPGEKALIRAHKIPTTLLLASQSMGQPVLLLSSPSAFAMLGPVIFISTWISTSSTLPGRPGFRFASRTDSILPPRSSSSGGLPNGRPTTAPSLSRSTPHPRRWRGDARLGTASARVFCRGTELPCRRLLRAC